MYGGPQTRLIFKLFYTYLQFATISHALYQCYALYNRQNADGLIKYWAAGGAATAAVCIFQYGIQDIRTVLLAELLGPSEVTLGSNRPVDHTINQVQQWSGVIHFTLLGAALCQIAAAIASMVARVAYITVPLGIALTRVAGRRIYGPTRVE